MQDSCTGTRLIFLVYLLFFSCSLLFGCNKSPEKTTLLPPPLVQELTVPSPLSSAELSAGVTVTYLDEFYRSVSQMPTPAVAKGHGRPGRPLSLFNHQFGKDDTIFDSGETRGVGMVMEGYLHLQAPGEYKFQALANDGIEFVIDGKLLFEDPNVHKDQLSPIGVAIVPAGGWYPLTIRYFQRKGTAALKLYWQPPGATDFTIIPKEAYAHK